MSTRKQENYYMMQVVKDDRTQGRRSFVHKYIQYLHKGEEPVGEEGFMPLRTTS